MLREKFETTGSVEFGKNVAITASHRQTEILDWTWNFVCFSINLKNIFLDVFMREQEISQAEFLRERCSFTSLMVKLEGGK